MYELSFLSPLQKISTSKSDKEFMIDSNATSIELFMFNQTPASIIIVPTYGCFKLQAKDDDCDTKLPLHG